MHNALVAAEVHLAVLLVAGAAVFTQSVSRLYAIDAGFGAVDVAAIGLVAPTRVMAAAALVAAMPRVRAAGLVTRSPLRDGREPDPVQAFRAH